MSSIIMSPFLPNYEIFKIIFIADLASVSVSHNQDFKHNFFFQLKSVSILVKKNSKHHLLISAGNFWRLRQAKLPWAPSLMEKDYVFILYFRASWSLSFKTKFRTNGQSDLPLPPLIENISLIIFLLDPKNTWT